MESANTAGGALPRKPFFQISGVRLRLWPIVLAAVLMQGILVGGRAIARAIVALGNEAWFDEHIWAYVILAGFFQFLLALVGIFVMRRVLPAADANLRWPPARSYVGLATVLGILMGVIMLLADYWPRLLSRTAPDASYALDPAGAAGWLTSMLITGLWEEPIFRGFLVGLLAALTPGRVRMGRFEIPLAGVIVALLFGLAHWRTFLVDPLNLAIAQQIYAFAWGLLYVWLMERSRSLLAPIVAHGVANFVEVALVMIMMIAWG